MDKIKFYYNSEFGEKFIGMVDFNDGSIPTYNGPRPDAVERIVDHYIQLGATPANIIQVILDGVTGSLITAKLSNESDTVEIAGSYARGNPGNSHKMQVQQDEVKPVLDDIFNAELSSGDGFNVGLPHHSWGK